MNLQSNTVILLDACSLINLYATGRLVEILMTVQARFVISDVVVREALYVRHFDGEAGERELINLQPVVEAGLIDIVVSDDEDELFTFIDLTELIDEGEAMSIAVAMHRGWSVMTDDRKAQRILLERSVLCISSLEIVQHWSLTTPVAPALLRAALRDIEQRARWVPWRAHPLAEWWKQAIDANG